MRHPLVSKDSIDFLRPRKNVTDFSKCRKQNSRMRDVTVHGWRAPRGREVRRPIIAQSGEPSAVGRGSRLAPYRNGSVKIWHGRGGEGDVLIDCR